MRRKTILAVALLLALACAALWVGLRRRSLAVPDAPAPGALLSAPAELPFRPGEVLEYEFGWNGMAAATLHVATSEARYEGQACLALDYEIRSVPAIERLWDYRAEGRTLMDPQTLLPIAAERTSRRGDREKQVTTRFDRDTGTAEVRTWQPSKQKTKTERVPLDGAVDMASAFLLLRTAPLDADRSARLRVLSGDEPYELLVRAMGDERVESRAGAFDATELDIRLRQMLDEEGPSEPEYRRARVWLSRRTRVPLRLESQVLVGHVYAELVRWQDGSAVRGAE